MLAHTHLMKWCDENKEMFAPPVCNKLLHKDQLSVMMVGGPNSRTDFHLDEGSEFFFQIKGEMQLPTIQAGERKLVTIKEGQVYLLPSRIPHSPQREAHSLGLVIERSRSEDEPDCLRWYTDFEKCDEILWEHYFHCGDLGRDLVPVVQKFKASEEYRTGRPSATSVVAEPPLVQDTRTIVPPPFDLWPWIDAHAAVLARGAPLPLFGEQHPDHEFSVHVVAGAVTTSAEAEPTAALSSSHLDTFLYQLRGPAATVYVDGSEQHSLAEGECCAIAPGHSYSVTRPAGSLGLVITQDPAGNKAHSC